MVGLSCARLGRAEMPNKVGTCPLERIDEDRKLTETESKGVRKLLSCLGRDGLLVETPRDWAVATFKTLQVLGRTTTLLAGIAQRRAYPSRLSRLSPACKVSTARSPWSHSSPAGVMGFRTKHSLILSPSCFSPLPPSLCLSLPFSRSFFSYLRLSCMQRFIFSFPILLSS